MAHDTKNFKVDEFACKCGKCENKIKQSTIDLAQKIRDAYGSAVRVNSGYRCPEHNKAVGGAKASKHMEGIACDLAPVDGDIKRFKQVISELDKKEPIGGIGLYPKFVHVDTRANKSRWNG